MELLSMLNTIWRWSWLILIITIAGGAILWLGLRSDNVPSYKSTVRLQLIAPEREDVAINYQYRYVSEREEVLLAQNNLTEILQSGEIRQQTISQLGLPASEGKYSVTISPINDSDFVDIVFEGPTEGLIVDIANAHVANGIVKMGEISSLPSIANLNYFTAQLATSREEMLQAETAFNQFQKTNGITSLDADIQTELDIIKGLELRKVDLLVTSEADFPIPVEFNPELDQLEFERQIRETEIALQNSKITNLIGQRNWLAQTEALRQSRSLNPVVSDELQELNATIEEETAALETLQEDNRAKNILALELKIKTLEEQGDPSEIQAAIKAEQIAQVDALIVEHRTELNQLNEIETEHNQLLLNLDVAREKFDLILEKEREADLKATLALETGFIQIVSPALTAGLVGSNFTEFLIIGVLVSLGLGIALVFVLEYLIQSARSQKSTEHMEPAAHPAPSGISDSTNSNQSSTTFA